MDKDTNTNPSVTPEAAAAAETPEVNTDAPKTPEGNTDAPETAKQNKLFSMLNSVTEFIGSGFDRVGSLTKGATSWVPVLNKVNVSAETNETRFEKTRNTVAGDRFVGLATTAITCAALYFGRDKLPQAITSFGSKQFDTLLGALKSAANVIPGVNLGGRG